MTEEHSRTGRGSPPQKYGFFRTLKVGHYHEVSDLSKYSALRTAASRANKQLKRKFTVSKEIDNGERGEVERTVIRVYRTK